ncbi:MAG TPA: efflux RND transporter periplasmic adaptor subunit [Phycisphaerae bacterium]|nr:efflux RND transporter periplasmic adaptor subunit [Phycisphaerae bacterium]
MSRLRREHYPLLTSFLTILLLLAGCQKQQQTQIPPALVNVATATTQDIPVLLSNIGTVQAVSSVTLQSRVDGQIAQVDIKPGEVVKKGDVLFVLDKQPYQAALLQAQATLEKDQATALDDHVVEDQEQQLLKAGAASPTEFLVAKYLASSADGQVLADKGAVQTAQLNLNYCTITAPFDGKIGNLLAFVGTNVLTTTTNLAVLNQIEPIYVAFALDQQNLSQIKQAFDAGEKLTVIAAIPGDAGPPPTGVLTFIDNQISSIGTILLMGTFQNQDQKLWPGQQVNATLQLSVLKNAVVVPSSAVQDGPNGTFVFVAQPDNTAKMVSVDEGVTYNGMSVINKGIQAGQIVITDGQLNVVPDGKIQIVRNGLIAGSSSTTEPADQGNVTQAAN